MAWNDRLSTAKPVAEITDSVAQAYRYALDKMLEDARDRLARFENAARFGGNLSETANARMLSEIKQSIGQLETALDEVAPLVADVTSTRTASWVNERQSAWLDGVAESAPAGAKRRVLNLFRDRARYLAKGSKLREVYAANLNGKGAPIHHRLASQAEQVLLDGMTSGETFGQIVTRMERDVFGVDYLKGEKHPALPKSDGTVIDAGYGQRKGYAKPSNPRGVLGDVKRLVKTELSDAYHEGRRTAMNDLREKGLIIGVHVEPELDSDYGLECPTCGPILEGATGDGPGDFLFADGEPPRPPYHPNCECSETGPIWD